MGEIAPALKHVTTQICDWCLVAKGKECHTPGCLFWMQDVPDSPILDRTTDYDPAELEQARKAINRAGALAMQGASHELIRQVLAEAQSTGESDG